MVKIFKLKKAVCLIILGGLSLIAFKIMEANKVDSAIYVLRLSGILLLIGAAYAIYPIFVARKVNNEEVQLDPEKNAEVNSGRQIGHTRSQE